MYLLNNIKFHQDKQHTIGDVQYPAGWFRDPLERAKIGVIEVADPVRPDDNLYTAVENPDGSFTTTPRTAEDLAARHAEAQTSFILKVDTDTDEIIRAVIGERASEYKLAEKEAMAYKAAGYAETVPSSVQAWATAKNWTATQAADDIITAATKWRTTQAAIRAERLLRKEQGKAAVDAATLDAIRAQWDAFITALRH